MAVIRDPMNLPGRRSTIYPAEFAAGFDKRIKRALGDAGGLTQFGVNLTTLEPGGVSSLRHWHAKEDEFIFILEGEAVLVTEAGEELLGAGMAATFPAGVPDAHQLVNRSNAPVSYLEIGTRAEDDEANYPDIDLRFLKREGQRSFVRKSGEPYE
ncbi:cupin domain-containing protein [Hyphomicrobium sp. NDB2Meth4]|uniref:cupin domain-containing protein n=1 Tax=Hyphomicrobium sp. NDB2Meth4 TaxID=1892846 RepID=UPI0009FA3B84|nr:cupin domain-containing protein [Hyphomicrobium sp. NDB2Meth4]